MQTIRALNPLRETTAALRRAAGRGARLALVPTMGALHDGHLTLVRRARELAEIVAVSIFVNPKQFGPNEDLDAYPRQLERDSELLISEGVDLLWAPEREEMYPEGYASNISVEGVSAGLCGADRPGHFDGVATVVCKLFNQVAPDIALFGEKDWQQLAVIRRMARDLDLYAPMPAAIIGVPIVREKDGLAMSSRNAYLSPGQRAAAAVLPGAMRDAIEKLAIGDPAAGVLEELKARLLSGGFDSIDYAELRDAASIELLDEPGDDTRLFVAARIGGTRLIDNMAVT
ncbi:pantoate--beta-alanine ligase [Croceicoccus sediminis]|uniref:pantoate--beta-alanine ligase n=1 Tax=Croceicoccus sediminis TaxID=2571150 RepID=UPI0011843009|nr:pantoate--beta-alanine ligase [Croceicoccus sediminis]